jgi:hypothetical protein
MGVAFLLSPLFPINSRSDSSTKLIYPKSPNQNQGGEERSKKQMMHAKFEITRKTPWGVRV